MVECWFFLRCKTIGCVVRGYYPSPVLLLCVLGPALAHNKFGYTFVAPHQHDVRRRLHHTRISAADPMKQHGQACVDAGIAEGCLRIIHRKYGADAIQQSQPAEVGNTVIPEVDNTEKLRCYGLERDPTAVVYHFIGASQARKVRG